MKKFLMITAVLAVLLSACGSPGSGETLIAREEAVGIALARAGLESSAVWDLDAELDRERGITVWEVDFESGNREYSYVLDAKTG